MPERDLCFTPATELARLIRLRKVSPLEVMRAVLTQIDRINPALNAYVTVARDGALRAARMATHALKRTAALPPLHGIPVSIKDLTPTKGIRTTWGSKIFEHHVPDEDALYVARLKEAGAIVVGKTNTPEFGAGGNTFNAVFGATRNPWNTALTCGGSSGGAAVALATGMGPLAQGSDLGGSLRTPAAFCGVVGFRTSPGLIPVYPADLGWDSLSVTGPMARTVGDVALMLSVMAGPDDYEGPTSFENGDLTKLLYLLREQFAYVVVDAGPNLGKSAGLLMELAESIYVVSQADIPGLRNARRYVSHLQRFGAEKVRLVMNRYDPRRHEIDEERIEKAVGVPVAWMIPNDYSAVSRSHNTAVPLMEGDSPVARMVRRMAREVCGKPLEPVSKKGFGLFR